MRQLATFESSEFAERFQDFLIARGIKCTLDEGDARPVLWIVDEDRLAEAKTELAAFLQQPDDPQYRQARAAANAVLQEEAAKRRAARRRVVSLSDNWRQPAVARCPITIGVIVACIFVYVDMHILGDQRGLSRLLFFSTDGTWNAIRSGEVWRLFTPMFMHGNFLHILFNLLIWWDFGLPIEHRKGPFKFLLIVAAVSLAGNVFQFQFGSPWFLGLSGVDFGLFGYLWMKGKLDPEDGLGVSSQQVQWLLLWFVICWFGLGGVANWCHTGGLVMGVLLGALSAGLRRVRL